MSKKQMSKMTDKQKICIECQECCKDVVSYGIHE
jgi:hypothetical protein